MSSEPLFIEYIRSGGFKGTVHVMSSEPLFIEYIRSGGLKEL